MAHSMCMCAWMYVYLLHECLWMSEKGIVSPETSVAGHCEIPGVCWELNPGLLQGQPVLLNHLSSPFFVVVGVFFLKNS